ncbi:hypothetical protein [Brucella tritici]|uniref:Uncharacterized protein n=1 Tax=Brucella tritici TaxID=94626 RepID=A0A6L3YF36_9HYPH|nr:hypothetical protein [Brucella tritici]KAB2680049.1 hypothetical protein F9L08_21870 [Brucella tritici]
MSPTPLSNWHFLFDTKTNEVHCMGFPKGGIAGEKIRVTSPIRKFDGTNFTTHSGSLYCISGDEGRDPRMIMQAILGFWKDLLNQEAGIDEVVLLQTVLAISADELSKLMLFKAEVAGNA